MAINTFATLKTSIASWLARDDLTTYIPDFITLFEAAAARRLRVRPMETTETLEPDDGEAALPSDYLGHRSLRWTGSPAVELEYVHPNLLRAMFPTAPAGTPTHYTIEGGNVIIRPVDDADLELLYSAKTSAVSSSLQWLFNNHPDAYLFGALAEAHGFNIDPAQLALWTQKRDIVFDEIQTLDFRERSGMAIRVMGQTP